MKHTPAPWKVSSTNYLEVRMNNPLCKDGPIALISTFGVDKECAMANTKLIAESPEMLEVLEGIEKWLNGEDNEFHTTAMTILKRLRNG